jgi:hypothetical protein
MAYEIDGIINGEERRLIVNLPPRSLKSITFSVALPAFLLGLDTDHLRELLGGPRQKTRE